MKNLFKSALLVLSAIFVSCNDGRIEELPTIPPTTPKPIEGLTAIVGMSEVTLSWKLVDADNTTGFELTYTPDGETATTIEASKSTYTVTGLENGTEYTFTMVAVNEDVKSTEVSVKATPKEEVKVSQIDSFKFEAALNPDMALDAADVADIDSAVIDHEAKTITIEGLTAYQYADNLIPTFTVSDGVTVTVGEEAQTSGVTAQDFTSEVAYVLDLDGDKTVYTVKVSKERYATIPDAEMIARLKSISEDFDFNDQDQLDITDEDVINFDGQLKFDSKEEGMTKLTSLKGIEFFVNLGDLRLEKNEVTSLDLRRNPKVAGLPAGWNKIAHVDVSNCPNMKSLYMLCNAELTELNIENNVKIEKLYVNGTGLTSLDVSKLVALKTLKIDVVTAEGSKEYFKALLEINPDVTIQYFQEDSPEDKDPDYVLDLE